MQRIAFILTFVLSSTTFLMAQFDFLAGQNDYEDSKGVVYNREFTVDVKLHTNGMALGVKTGQLKSYYLTRFLNFEIGEIKHRKEFRQSRDFPPTTSGQVSRAFVFGKQNNLLVLRGGVGEKRYLSEKAKRRGLAVGITYEVGPSIGLLKPYYLDIQLPRTSEANDGSVVSMKFSEETASDFLEINQIVGSSGFSKGLTEITPVLGGYAKFAVHFDWGAFDEFVKAIEAGVMVDVYSRNMPLMVESDLVEDAENRPFFLNLYLNLQLGKRW